MHKKQDLQIYIYIKKSKWINKKICIFKNVKLLKLVKTKEVRNAYRKLLDKKKKYRYEHVNYHCFKILCLLSRQAKQKNHRHDVMNCARYHNWKITRQIDRRSKMGIKNIKISTYSTNETKIEKLNENPKQTKLKEK